MTVYIGSFFRDSLLESSRYGKPVTTEKIALPKNLQREMIKFFIQASMSKNTKEHTDKDKLQTSLNKTAEES